MILLLNSCSLTASLRSAKTQDGFCTRGLLLHFHVKWINKEKMNINDSDYVLVNIMFLCEKIYFNIEIETMIFKTNAREKKNDFGFFKVVNMV